MAALGNACSSWTVPLTEQTLGFRVSQGTDARNSGQSNILGWGQRELKTWDDVHQDWEDPCEGGPGLLSSPDCKVTLGLWWGG